MTQSYLNPVKTLLDLPSEVIEKIISNLQLEDRLAFGLSCKLVNEILNKQSSFWEDVSLNVNYVIKSKYKCNMNRKYKELTWDLSELPSTLLVHEIITRFKLKMKSITLNVKSLKLKYLESELLVKEIELITSCLRSFNHLTRLNIVLRRTFNNEWLKNNLPPPSSGHHRTPIDFHSLEYLSIPVDLLDFLIHHRFVNISSSRLITFEANKPSSRLDLSETWNQAILQIIKRQERLKDFHLASDYSFLFDEKLVLKSQLRYFYGATNEDFASEHLPILSRAQQYRMVEFLTSQTELQRVEFEFRLTSTQRMLVYRWNCLGLPEQDRSLDINPENFRIGTKSFTVAELGHLPDNLTVNTSIDRLSFWENGNRITNKEWILDVLLKFPKLRCFDLYSNSNFDYGFINRIQELIAAHSAPGFKFRFLNDRANRFETVLEKTRNDEVTMKTLHYVNG